MSLRLSRDSHQWANHALQLLTRRGVVVAIVASRAPGRCAWSRATCAHENYHRIAAGLVIGSGVGWYVGYVQPIRRITNEIEFTKRWSGMDSKGCSLRCESHSGC